MINLFHVKIQEPESRSTTTTAFVFLTKFIIAKHLKQEADDDLSDSVDECNLFRLSITGDIKIYQSHVTGFDNCSEKALHLHAHSQQFRCTSHTKRDTNETEHSKSKDKQK